MTPDFISAMETIFRGEMVAEYGPDLLITYSNVPVSNTVETFIAFHVIASDLALPINLGGDAATRNAGILQIDVFTPKDTGAGDGRRIAHFAGKIFKRRKITVSNEGYATLLEYAIQDRGEVRGRHKEMVSIGYRYDFVA